MLGAEEKPQCQRNQVRGGFAGGFLFGFVAVAGLAVIAYIIALVSKP